MHKRSKAKDRWIFEHAYDVSQTFSLFCFPFAGGNALSYSHWLSFLPSNYNLLAIQYPGRQCLANSPPRRDLQELAKELVEHIAPYLEGRTIFFGHSLGALVAFELTKLLESQKKIIEALFVSACVSPDEVVKEQGIHHLSDKEFLEKIIDYGGTPTELFQDKELMNYFLPILKADFYMYETYAFNPSEKINSPILTFGSHDDSYAPLSYMDGWGQVTSNAHQLISAEGDHFYINDKASNFSEKFLFCLEQIKNSKQCLEVFNESV